MEGKTLIIPIKEIQSENGQLLEVKQSFHEENSDPLEVPEENLESVKTKRILRALPLYKEVILTMIPEYSNATWSEEEPVENRVFEEQGRQSLLGSLPSRISGKLMGL